MQTFTDDPTIPEETKIYYAKGKNLFTLLFGLLFMAGSYPILSGDTLLIGLAFIGAGAYMAFKAYRQLTDRNAQIILNAKGIATVSAPFTAWSDVTHEDVKGMLGDKKKYLVYERYSGAQEELLINDLAIGRNQLRHLLRIYRGRSMSGQR